jgi:hypothetical protein
MGGNEMSKIKTSELTGAAIDEAFVQAYADNVADAPEEVVREFLEVDDHDQFYKNHSEYYGSIADAYGVWNAALIYARGLK